MILADKRIFFARFKLAANLFGQFTEFEKIEFVMDDLLISPLKFTNSFIRVFESIDSMATALINHLFKADDFLSVLLDLFEHLPISFSDLKLDRACGRIDQHPALLFGNARYHPFVHESVDTLDRYPGHDHEHTLDKRTP